MKEHFTIRVETRFEAAHHLRAYKGAPEPLHGHSWKVEAKFICRALDSEDIGVDYVECEKAIREIGAHLDHKYINELPPFDKINPTSENIARWFFDELKKKEHLRNAGLDEVVVWEGPASYVAYRCD